MNPLDILYEDKDLIVVHKPSGVAVQSGRISEPDMASMLCTYLKTDHIGIIHRLDQPVEGILVFGKNKAAATSLSAQIRERIFNKTYDVISVLQSADLPEKGRLTDSIETDRKRNLSFITDVAGAGKEAILDYRICKDWTVEDGTRLIHIKVDLVTGRRHQIRLQLSHAGMPILGDRKYGKMTDGYSGNICLAATGLSFRHPTSNELLEYKITPEFIKMIPT
jgi:23S rRNA pseudouridine1911/1915/1917 synthase